MATLEQIERALRNADAAGNAADARRLANAYKAQKARQATAPDASTPNPAIMAAGKTPLGPGGELARDAVTAGADMAGDAAEFVTGGDRRAEGVPNLLNSGATFGLSPADQAKLAGSLLVANDKGRQRNAVWEYLPDADIYEDENGFDVIEVNGEKAYLNGPGISQMDVAKGVSDAVQMLPWAKGYGAVSRIPGVAGKALGLLGLGATSGAGLSVSQDLASNALGQGEGISGTRAGIYAAGGALGEGAAMVGNRLVRQVGRGGIGTEEQGRQVARKVDMDYDAMRPDVQTEARALGRQAANPEAFARQLRANNQPVPVPLTAGRATRGTDPAQASKLALAETTLSREGDPAYLAHRNQATQALLDNMNAIKTGSPGQEGLTAAQGGARVSDTLNAMRGAEKGQVDALYRSARAGLSDARRQGVEPAVARADFTPVIRQVRNSLLNEGGFSHRGAPKTWGELARLIPKVQPGSQVKEVKLSRILDSLRELKTLSRAGGVSPSPDNVAAGKAAGMLQAQLDDMFEQGIMSGDEAVLQPFKQAGYARRQFGERWEAGDILQRLTAKDPAGRGDRLAVAPEAAADAIFGVSSSGITTSRSMSRELRALKNRLGADSEGWDAVRQAAMDRFMNPAKVLTENGEGVSGVKLSTAWARAKRENPEVIGELFTSQQRKAMDDFVDVADWATRQLTGTDHSANNLRAITSVLGNTGYRMATSGAAPAYLKWLGILPGVGQLFSAKAKQKIVEQVLQGVKMERIPASERARIMGLAAGVLGVQQVDGSGQGEQITEQ